MAPSTLPTPLVKGADTVALNAVTATGTSSVYEFFPRGSGEWPMFLYWQTLMTGSPTGIGINLEGSEDATNWNYFDQSTSTAGESRSVVNIFPRYVRVNLTTLTGGTSPTVTVTLGAR